MLKKINKAFALLSIIPLISSCKAEDNFTVPNFEKSQGIKFNAYAGPTVENWAGSNQNINTITDEHYQKLEDAGFNSVIALYEGAGGGSGSTALETTKKVAARAQEHAKLALAQAEKHNIKYYVRDWSFYGMFQQYTDSSQYEDLIRNGIFNDSIDYYKSKAYAGNFCSDEPSNTAQLDLIAKQVDIYNEIMKEKGIDGECFINLNPMYVSELWQIDPQDSSKNKKISYEEYARYYFEKIGSKIGYVSYDYYPFYMDDLGNSSVRSSYLQNLELMARLSKDNNAELRTFIQAVGNWTGMRRIDYISDFRFQIYTSLAFGAKQMTYYQYAGHAEKGENRSTDALFDYVDGSYNYTYDLAKTVNNEVHNFEDAYLSYDYCDFTTKLGDEMTDNINFSSIENQRVDPEGATIETCDQDTLMTHFKNKDNDDAFMLVNFIDPYLQKDDTVTVKFNNAKGLLMYRLGQKTIVNLNSDSTYTFKLYPGEGRFIIPLH